MSIPNYNRYQLEQELQKNISPARRAWIESKLELYDALLAEYRERAQKLAPMLSATTLADKSLRWLVAFVGVKEREQARYDNERGRCNAQAGALTRRTFGF